jgi:hypothetical protein
LVDVIAAYVVHELADDVLDGLVREANGASICEQANPGPQFMRVHPDEDSGKGCHKGELNANKLIGRR